MLQRTRPRGSRSARRGGGSRRLPVQCRTCTERGMYFLAHVIIAAGDDTCNLSGTCIGTSNQKTFSLLRTDDPNLVWLGYALQAPDCVIVGDFGLATTWSSIAVRKKGCGTLHYCSPEMLQHTRSYIGPEVDLWSLGTHSCFHGTPRLTVPSSGGVLYTMLTGRVPFGANRSQSYDALEVCQSIREGNFGSRASFSPELQDLLSKLFNPDPLKRATMFDVLRM